MVVAVTTALFVRGITTGDFHDQHVSSPTLAEPLDRPSAARRSQARPAGRRDGRECHRPGRTRARTRGSSRRRGGAGHGEALPDRARGGRLLGVSQKTVNRRLRAGLLRKAPLGGRIVRITAAEFARFAAAEHSGQWQYNQITVRAL